MVATPVGPQWVLSVLDLFDNGRKSKEDYRDIADWLRELEKFYTGWAAPRKRGAPRKRWIYFSGARLKQLREEISGVEVLPGRRSRKRSSQAALAAFCEVTVDTVQSWEKEGRAQARHFWRIVAYLHQHNPGRNIEAALVNTTRH